MVGDGAANAEVSGSGRECERDRPDAETVSGTVGTAERPEADVPPGLWQFARKKLREAYFHAARASDFGWKRMFTYPAFASGHAHSWRLMRPRTSSFLGLLKNTVFQS